MSFRISRRLLVAAVLLTLTGCVQRHTVIDQPQACADTQHLRLGAQPPASLTAREFTRLQDLERACAASHAAAGTGSRHAMMGMDSRTMWGAGVMTLVMVGMGLLMRY